MGAEVVDGRAFSPTDLDRADSLAVVDDQAAARLYPGGRVAGKTVWVEESGRRRPLEIVGVVRHLRHSIVIGSEREVIYRLAPAARTMALVVRTGSGTMSAIPDLRGAAVSLDPRIPLFDVRTLADHVADQTASARFAMTLAVTFSVIALGLATIGIYGVVSYAATQRRSEFGLRMALGASERSILRLVVQRGFCMAGAGILVGLAVAASLTRTLESLLVDVSATDPLTFSAVVAVFAVAALAASYIPARRASRLDPAVTLRAD
jgi:ABC-type antimicrobial peptide transport system permease subunit